jgi:hypothetical protein
MGHMTEKHRHQLAPARNPLFSSLSLMFGNEFGKLCSGKVMKKLTKQARYLYHKYALFGDCD